MISDKKRFLIIAGSVLKVIHLMGTRLSVATRARERQRM